MTDEVRIRILKGMADVSAADWDACANPSAASGRLESEINSAAKSIELDKLDKATCEPFQDVSADTSKSPHNPFISHAFLLALEASGSATAKTGWMPQHLVAERDGKVVGVVPCYLKSHSRGEYVFDRGWADAYERAGGSYYPKLQVSVPFTPATGPRLLVPPGDRADQLRAALAQGLVEVCQAHR